MDFIVSWLVSAIAILIAAYIIPGVRVNSFLVALLVAAVLGIVNALVRPLLVLLTLPITILTLGIFLLVINALLILLVDAIVPGFEVRGFWNALLFSIILTIIVSIFNLFI